MMATTDVRCMNAIDMQMQINFHQSFRPGATMRQAPNADTLMGAPLSFSGAGPSTVAFRRAGFGRCHDSLATKVLGPVALSKIERFPVAIGPSDIRIAPCVHRAAGECESQHSAHTVTSLSTAQFSTFRRCLLVLLLFDSFSTDLL